MGKREKQQQNKRSYEQVDGDESMVDVNEEQMDVNDTNNNTGKVGKKNMSKQREQVHVKEEEEFEDAEQDEEEEDEEEDEEDVVEEEEEIEEEVEEDEEEEEEEDEETADKAQKSSSQGTNQATSQSSGQQNTESAAPNSGPAGPNTDKRPRLTDELYEMNLRRKKEHVCSALYIPFPRKVTEEQVRAFVGQGPNIFLVGPQKQNAIVRYRTQAECEKQRKELAEQEFEGVTLQIEPKTVKIDPANIDVKTLIVQYSNPDLSIMDFAQIFIKAISISLKGGKSKKESQDDLSFGSAIIIFPSHEEAKEAFLATENLNIKGEQLRVVFADFRPANANVRPIPGGFGFRNKGGDNNRGNFIRGNQGGRPGGNFNRNNNMNNNNRNNNTNNRNDGGRGGQRNFGNRNFNQNSGNQGGGGGGNYQQGGGGRGYSPNKKFRPNVR